MYCITSSFKGFTDAPKWTFIPTESWWSWRLKSLIISRFLLQLWSISGICNSSRAGNKPFSPVFKIYLYQALHHFDFMIHVFMEIYRTILIAPSCSRLSYPGVGTGKIWTYYFISSCSWDLDGSENWKWKLVFCFLGYWCEFEYRAVWILMYYVRWV